MGQGEADKELGGANASNAYAQNVDEAEGLDKIESLQNHPKDEVHEKAVKILETFFGFEDEEDQNLAPTVSLDSLSLAHSELHHVDANTAGIHSTSLQLGAGGGPRAAPPCDTCGARRAVGHMRCRWMRQRRSTSSPTPLRCPKAASTSWPDHRGP